MKRNKINQVGEYIKYRREELGLLQEDLASKIGIAPSTLSLYESGKRMPDLETLKAIARVLKTNLARIVNVEIPEADLETALRAQGLSPEDMNRAKHYISYLKHLKKEKQ